MVANFIFLVKKYSFLAIVRAVLVLGV